MIFHEFPVARGKRILSDRIEKIKSQVDVNEHVRILAPVKHPRALRELMPDHACRSVLVLKNELEFLASPLVLASRQKGLDGDHSVPGEESVVLRTPSFAGGAVSRNDSAAELGITYPRLIKSNFRPGDSPIYVGIRGFDL